MHDAASALKAWETFYVIVGSSSAALTGLMFVVVSLMPEARARLNPSMNVISAFASPTVVHLCLALLASAILSAPWSDLWQAGLAVAGTGAGGFVYTVIVMRRMRQQRDYRPVVEDWIWHAGAPVAAYAVLTAAGLLLAKRTDPSLFGAAASTLLLLFIGIHNAWDTVTYVVTERAAPPHEPRNRHRRKD